jgi:two-component system CheB/CheR fusion protein
MDVTARVPGTDRLLAVIRDLSFCRTLQDVMNIARREARDLTGADGVTFVLRDGDRCHYAEENAIAPLWKGRRFPMKTCISGWVMLNRQVAVIEDIYADPRIPADAYRPTFVKSLAMVPVRESEPLGAIGAYWAANHRASVSEVRILQSIADASALALENVRLYDNLQTALDRAEALNRAKDEWMSVISHELRTPLTPILGWTKMLQAAPLDVARQRHALAVIERNVMEEIRIVNDLLDVSRLMVGKTRIEAQPLDVRAPVRAAVDATRPDAERKGVQLTASLPDEPVGVLGDGTRLEQAVWNLANNAIKFTPTGGTVEVSVTRSQDQASVIVRDTGDGIAAEVLPRLFTRFERADSSMTRSDGGLGLGLFLVRRITELHGGSVTAHSDGHGHGSMFGIHLPLQDGEAPHLQQSV